MERTRKVAFIGTSPIPLGHEVELTWYESREVGMSFLGSEKVNREDLPTPRVRDLTTGVVYGHMAHYRGDGGIHPGRLNVEDAVLRTDLHERERVTGTVRRCDVIVISFDRAGREVEHTETHLEIEVS